MSKAEELAQKLKALADRGIGGEQVNAQMMLEKHLKKHGITLEQLEENTEKFHQMQFTNKEHMDFSLQVISSVMGKGKYAYSKKDDYFEIKTTNVIFIECRAKIDFFWKILKEEQKLFYRAFIQRNGLWVLGTDLLGDDDREYTDEEIEASRKLHKLMGGMDEHDFQHKSDPEVPDYLKQLMGGKNG